MLPLVFCNLYTTVSYPPWPESSHRECYVTEGGEKRIPFHAYIQSSDGCASSSSSGSTLFNRLPQELQLHILSMCSASSLFQLMRVSSRLRVEASKLFWAKEDAYFLVQTSWLLEGAYLTVPLRIQIF